jgi:hypothetical protein
MNRPQHRLMTILAATSAALAIGAAPALAGSDGCSGGDCQDESSPAQVVPALPAPVALGDDDVAPVQSLQPVARRTVPRGAVAAGAGGMAPKDQSGLPIGVGGAGLVLLAAGGGIVASGRRARP